MSKKDFIDDFNIRMEAPADGEGLTLEKVKKAMAMMDDNSVRPDRYVCGRCMVTISTSLICEECITKHFVL